jgi:hypothetical protein
MDSAWGVHENLRVQLPHKIHRQLPGLGISLNSGSNKIKLLPAFLTISFFTILVNTKLFITFFIDNSYLCRLNLG